MNQKIKLTLPVSEYIICDLSAGDFIELTGVIYTARDAAHKRMLEGYESGEGLPIALKNQALYFAGPSPAKPNEPVGSIGPTTSYRMDAYSPRTLDLGLKIMIGKGERSKEVVDSMIKNRAIYVAAIGGAGALLSNHIKSCEVVAYDDLGAEAIHRLEVKDFPGIVVIDSKGNNLYNTEVKKYREVKKHNEKF